MFRLACVLGLVIGCGGGGGDPPGVDAPPSAACQEATTYQDLATIENKILRLSCIFSGCHNGANTDAGRLDLRAGMAHASLVGVPSEIEPSRTLVVPGDPAKSYLLLMVGQIAPEDADPPGNLPPSEIGLMPQGTGGILLCAEKRDAIERWIAEGALDN